MSLRKQNSKKISQFKNSSILNYFSKTNVNNNNYIETINVNKSNNSEEKENSFLNKKRKDICKINNEVILTKDSTCDKLILDNLNNQTNNNNNNDNKKSISRNKFKKLPNKDLVNNNTTNVNNKDYSILKPFDFTNELYIDFKSLKINNNKEFVIIDASYYSTIETCIEEINSNVELEDMFVPLKAKKKNNFTDNNIKYKLLLKNVVCSNINSLLSSIKIEDNTDLINIDLYFNSYTIINKINDLNYISVYTVYYNYKLIVNMFDINNYEIKYTKIYNFYDVFNKLQDVNKDIKLNTQNRIYKYDNFLNYSNRIKFIYSNSIKLIIIVFDNLMFFAVEESKFDNSTIDSRIYILHHVLFKEVITCISTTTNTKNKNECILVSLNNTNFYYYELKLIAQEDNNKNIIQLNLEVDLLNVYNSCDNFKIQNIDFISTNNFFITKADASLSIYDKINFYPIFKLKPIESLINISRFNFVEDLLIYTSYNPNKFSFMKLYTDKEYKYKKLIIPKDNYFSKCVSFTDLEYIDFCIYCKNNNNIECIVHYLKGVYCLDNNGYIRYSNYNTINEYISKKKCSYVFDDIFKIFYKDANDDKNTKLNNSLNWYEKIQVIILNCKKAMFLIYDKNGFFKQLIYELI